MSDKALSVAELERRMPVWEALSELFLGTELQDYTYRWIAEKLRDSRYTLDELEAILRTEVGPAFRSNISGLNPAPEMLGWSKEAIRGAILEQLTRPHDMLSRISLALQGDVLKIQPVQSRWRMVSALLQQEGGTTSAS